MNVLVKTGAVLASTLACYGLTYELTSHTTYTAAELNPKIEACARQLGTAALQSENLPPQCRKLPDSPDNWFSYREIDVYTHHPSSDTSGTSSRVYTLPPRKSFLRTNIITSADDKKRVQEAETMAGLASGLGFIMFSGYLGFDSLHRRRVRQTPA
jgi:hypothetical protein